IAMKGPFGTKLPPLIKVRIARVAEREAFEANTDNLDIYNGVKVVRLIDVNEIRNKNQKVERSVLTIPRSFPTSPAHLSKATRVLLGEKPIKKLSLVERGCATCALRDRVRWLRDSPFG